MEYPSVEHLSWLGIDDSGQNILNQLSLPLHHHITSINMILFEMKVKFTLTETILEECYCPKILIQMAPLFNVSIY